MNISGRAEYFAGINPVDGSVYAIYRNIRFSLRQGNRQVWAYQYRSGKTGAPIVLRKYHSYIECEVIGSLDAGTHTIFLGKVIEAEQLNTDEPMTLLLLSQDKSGLSPKALRHISKIKLISCIIWKADMIKTFRTRQNDIIIYTWRAFNLCEF